MKPFYKSIIAPTNVISVLLCLFLVGYGLAVPLDRIFGLGWGTRWIDALAAGLGLIFALALRFAVTKWIRFVATVDRSEVD